MSSSLFLSSPGPQHFDIVALETFFTPIPTTLAVPSPHTFTLTEYQKTGANEAPRRIKDAHIVIITTVALGTEALSQQNSPNLKLIIALASGTDSIDLVTCLARGIRVLSCPECNSDAVAEHAVALYFATRRFLFPTMSHLRADEWPRRGTLMTSTYTAGQPPRSCRQETVAIVGHGGVGRRVERLLGALGMKVIIAGRKGGPVPPPQGRIPFEEALRMATVVVLCCPLTAGTRRLLSHSEFALMREDSVLVHVARGGVVDEAALLVALRNGEIAGAGVDVFCKEPASHNSSPLLCGDVDGLNLVTTPHTAWVGGDSTANYQRALQENINGFILGKVAEERIKV